MDLHSLYVLLDIFSRYVALIAHTYHLDITDRTRLGEEPHQLSQLASRRLCYQLAYPRDLALLPSVRTAILDHLGRAG